MRWLRSGLFSTDWLCVHLSESRNRDAVDISSNVRDGIRVILRPNDRIHTSWQYDYPIPLF
jgi:hypothetical protein